MIRPFNLGNPSFKCRVILVACTLPAPGALAGAMTDLFLGEFAICAVVGALVGAILGAVMEAWPSAKRHFSHAEYLDFNAVGAVLSRAAMHGNATQVRFTNFSELQSVWGTTSRVCRRRKKSRCAPWGEALRRTRWCVVRGYFVTHDGSKGARARPTTPWSRGGGPHAPPADRVTGLGPAPSAAGRA
jgi:hypothetical protein